MAYSWDHDSSVSWSIIRDLDSLGEAARELADQSIIGWDVETNGLNPYVGRRIIGHSFAWRRSNGQTRAVYIPIRHESYLGLFSEVDQLGVEAVSEAIRPALEGSALKCGHNLRFDVQFARMDGLWVAPKVHDTMIAAKLISENERSYKLGACLLKAGIPHDEAWKDSVNPSIREQMGYFKLKKKEILARYGYKFISIESLGRYAAQDAAYELWLAESQFDLVARWRETWDLEMDVFWVGVDMSWIGVPIDVESLKRLEADQQQRMAELSVQIWKEAGREFDISNDNQIRKILFEELELEPQGETKGSRSGPTVYSVDDDALWKLEKHHGSKIAGLLREYSSSEKIVSTYTRNIVERADSSGILHGEFRQLGAATGRASMAEPNLQNIPTRTALGRRVKSAFIAREGQIRFCVDYSQVELRILAQLSQDPSLLRVYHEDLDVHTNTAVEAFGTSGVVGGIDMRRVAKILNFGIPFGITSFGVMRNINKDLPDGVPEIDEDRAEGFLRKWFHKYGGVESWRRRLKYEAVSNRGYVVNLFGRPRRVPGIIERPGYALRRAERQLVSSMVQGGAADLVKRAMVLCHKYLKEEASGAVMVLMVHDDLQFDMPPDGSARRIRELVRLMESAGGNRVGLPIKADVEYFTTNWGEKKKLAL